VEGRKRQERLKKRWLGGNDLFVRAFEIRIFRPGLKLEVIEEETEDILQEELFVWICLEKRFLEFWRRKEGKL